MAPRSGNGLGEWHGLGSGDGMGFRMVVARACPDLPWQCCNLPQQASKCVCPWVDSAGTQSRGARRASHKRAPAAGHWHCCCRGVPPASWPRLPRRPGLLHRGSPHSRGRRCGPGGRRCRCCCWPRAAQRWGWGRGAASPSGPTEPREMWTSRSPGPSSNRWGPNSWQQHNILGPLGGPFLAGPMPQGHMCRSLTGRGRGPQGLNSGPGKPEQHLGMDP